MNYTVCSWTDYYDRLYQSPRYYSFCEKCKQVVYKCQFEPSSNTTSATVCKWCGQEKSQHSINGTMNQPNQPPKSAEEVLNDAIGDAKFHLTQEFKDAVLKAMQSYASQFARYVTDEEIDAMFPYLLVGSVREQTKWNEMQEMRRIGAKAMRDMIFGGVKQ